jgi:2-(1,2-epoxy-1,2-dihydrophenyl)acetyl-CoA isomerase
MNYKTLEFEVSDQIATITLSRPDAANSLNQQMGDELLMVANHCASNADIRAVILTAAGKMFCAGGDVAGFADSENPGELLRGITSGLHAAIQRFQRTAEILFWPPSPPNLRWPIRVSGCLPTAAARFFCRAWSAP